MIDKMLETILNTDSSTEFFVLLYNYLNLHPTGSNYPIEIEAGSFDDQPALCLPINLLTMSSPDGTHRHFKRSRVHTLYLRSDGQVAWDILDQDSIRGLKAIQSKMKALLHQGQLPLLNGQ